MRSQLPALPLRIAGAPSHEHCLCLSPLRAFISAAVTNRQTERHKTDRHTGRRADTKKHADRYLTAVERLHTHRQTHAQTHTCSSDAERNFTVTPSPSLDEVTLVPTPPSLPSPSPPTTPPSCAPAAPSTRAAARKEAPVSVPPRSARSAAVRCLPSGSTLRGEGGAKTPRAVLGGCGCLVLSGCRSWPPSSCSLRCATNLACKAARK